MTTALRILYALRAVASWIARPPDFPVMEWANQTHEED